MADLNTIGGIHYEMMRRCYNPKSVSYKDYGAKGISVCEEWHDREKFKKWARENGYVSGLRLNRIDSAKDYEPSNCIFGLKSTKKKNGYNQKIKQRAKDNKQKKKDLGITVLSETRLSRILNGMRSRCNNKNDKHYNYYGGRGISVCDEWSGRQGIYNFYKWALENGYNDKLTIDRIDNNKGYSPENCRWATMEEQARNRRNTIILDYNGNKHTISEVSNDLGISYNSLYELIHSGMNVQEAIEKLKVEK